ncbi:hypothetical protein [Sulfuriflexus mobilis]|uniref:hypothetical protein n=1 Tax=Sulfuriflexus mobilis TaxID=1811807 RepID=UPI000F8285B0|nr:hypothetical protein [Sulfuriflexus mobilis]
MSKVLIVAAIIMTSIVVIAYLSIFAGPIAANQEKWGQFGDYIGGVLNPFIAFLALIALLHTIKIQKIELKKTITHFENESKKADLNKIIESLHRRIKTSIEKQIVLSDDMTVSLDKAISGGEDVLQNEMLATYFSYHKRLGHDANLTINSIIKELEQLQIYIERYETLTEELKEKSPFPRFYKSEFNKLTRVLNKNELINDKLYQFYSYLEHDLE